MNNRPLHLRLISHGVVVSGGSQYADFLMNELPRELSDRKITVTTDHIKFDRLYRGLQNILLMFQSFLAAKADVNIVMARQGISALVRSRLTRNKTLIIMHNYDENDGKGWFLKMYYKWLFKMLGNKPANAAIVTDSPYFSRYFMERLPGLPVFWVPNLFNTKAYEPAAKDPKKILLGQYSYKNDEAIFDLAKRLSKKGYYCYFLTLDKALTGQYNGYEVKSLPFHDYIREMATSYCTLALSRVKEGWNRMAHESILMGTPVIGYDSGGLGILLHESDSYIIKSTDEAFDLICNQKVICRTSLDFISRYDIKNAASFFEPLVGWVGEY